MANPVLTVSTSSYASSGFVRLTWTNANKGVNWYSWRVYRRPTGGNWTLLKEYLGDVANYTFDDYMAPANTSLEYVVVRVYLVGTVVTEEAKIGGQTVTPDSDNYWLIHPFDNTKTMLLYQVTADDFTDEHAQVEHEVIGRGRKVDQGTQWGIRGSMACQLRDKYSGPTARLQLQNLRAAKQAASYWFLRNPWGDIWRVSIGNINVTRIAGVGDREFVDVSFPYVEIAA